MPIVIDTSHYDGALAWLYSRINYERSGIPAYRVLNFKLERMRELMRRLGDPHRALPIIHVAGTKGKGSTSSMLAAVLTAAGYRTGLYTSPHLERTEERLAIDGEICPPDEFVRLVESVRPAIESMDEEGERFTGAGCPTFFEVMTAMALVYFAREKVDAVVLEVGLGGRLDSTNIVSPLLTVITSISFDHMRQLGDTLALIAGEKAGIIKPGVPVVTGVMPEEREAFEVIERVARENKATLVAARQHFQHSFLIEELHGARKSREKPAAITGQKGKLPRGRLYFDGRLWELSDIELGLMGEHQAANAAVALATLELLAERGWKIGTAAIQRGLRDVRCPARIEVLAQNPTVIVDTAHNAASIAALLEVLNAATGFAARHLVFACSKDKDAAGMLAQLLPHFDRVVLTRFENNPRAIPPEELREIAARTIPPTETAILTAPDPRAAWQLAQTSASANDLICITGSFFLAAELRGIAKATWCSA